MKIKYFSDTDTALVEFFDKKVAETREINENIYIDLDEDGSLVSMTIEHAREKANIAELSFIQMTGSQLFQTKRQLNAEKADWVG